MTVLFMPNAVQTSACFCKAQAAFTNICWKIIHAGCTDAGNFFAIFKNINLFGGISGRANLDTELTSAFTSISCNGIHVVDCGVCLLCVCCVFVIDILSEHK